MSDLRTQRCYSINFSCRMSWRGMSQHFICHNIGYVMLGSQNTNLAMTVY